MKQNGRWWAEGLCVSYLQCRLIRSLARFSEVCCSQTREDSSSEPRRLAKPVIKSRVIDETRHTGETRRDGVRQRDRTETVGSRRREAIRARRDSGRPVLPFGQGSTQCRDDWGGGGVGY